MLEVVRVGIDACHLSASKYIRREVNCQTSESRGVFDQNWRFLASAIEDDCMTSTVDPQKHDSGAVTRARRMNQSDVPLQRPMILASIFKCFKEILYASVPVWENPTFE